MRNAKLHDWWLPNFATKKSRNDLRSVCEPCRHIGRRCCESFEYEAQPASRSLPYEPALAVWTEIEHQYPRSHPKRGWCSRDSTQSYEHVAFCFFACAALGNSGLKRPPPVAPPTYFYILRFGLLEGT